MLRKMLLAIDFGRGMMGVARWVLILCFLEIYMFYISANPHRGEAVFIFYSGRMRNLSYHHHVCAAYHRSKIMILY